MQGAIEQQLPSALAPLIRELLMDLVAMLAHESDQDPIVDQSRTEQRARIRVRRRLGRRLGRSARRSVQRSAGRNAGRSAGRSAAVRLQILTMRGGMRGGKASPLTPYHPSQGMIPQMNV